MATKHLGFCQEPTSFGGLEPRNRVFRSATNEYLGDEDGSVSPAQIDLARVLGESGLGLIITGNFCVSPEGRHRAAQNILYGDGYDKGRLRALVDAVHGTGALIVAQLGHAGGRAKNEYAGPDGILAPSALRFEDGAAPARAADQENLERLAEAFASAALAAKEAGFDGAQIHCAHGYLLSQFRSPQWNRREDAYGGPNGFGRYPARVAAAARRVCGAGFPLWVKMDVVPEGETDAEKAFEDAAEILMGFKASGIDAVELSGIDFRTRKAGDGAFYRAELSRLAAAVAMPLALVGGARSPGDLEGALEAGAGLVGLARPLIREPDLLARFAAGQKEAACISCNACFACLQKTGKRCVFH